MAPTGLFSSSLVLEGSIVGSLSKLCALFVSLVWACFSSFASAEAGGSITQVRQPANSIDPSEGYSSNVALPQSFILYGISFEMAVRLGLPLGPLVRGRSVSENMNHSQSAEKSIETDHASEKYPE